MHEEKGGVIARKPSTKRRIIFPAMRQIFAVEEMHLHGLNIKDFSVYLTGTEKFYEGDDRNFDEPGIEYQMATRFIKNLHILSGKNSRRPILVHMKTCGGYWEEGMAIYDALCACPNPITILSYTHARSMSSLILQAADKRVLMPHSYFLFHEGTLELQGTNRSVLSGADWIKRVVNPIMLEIYTQALKRKGKYSRWSPSRIRAILQGHMDKKEDVYLTAQEAVDWGFADEIFGGSNGHFDWRSLRKYSEKKVSS